MFYKDKTKENGVLLFILVSCISLASSAYVAINGQHDWRQADVYGHILGFMNYKKMMPLQNFFGDISVFDIPIYQYAIAKMSFFLKSDSLVLTRFFNIFWWLTLIISGYQFSEKTLKGSGFLLVFLLCTSPLFLHYYATPLPDVMAISLSMVAINLLYKAPLNWKRVGLASAAILVAALIKSPIPFVFVVLFLILVSFEESPKFFVRHSKTLVFFAVAAVAAVAAELIRRAILGTNELGFAQDPKWYFGDVTLRVSKNFWKTIMWRTVDAYPWRGVGFLIVVPMLLGAAVSRSILRTLAPFFISFFSGWLVFSNVYAVHDYYELPVTVVLFMSTAIFYQTILNKISVSKAQAVKWGLIVSMPLVVVLMPKESEYKITNMYDVMTYLLKERGLFLYVNDNQSGGDNGPVLGGKVGTPFVLVSPDEFQNNCMAYINKYDAIVIKGSSTCIDRLPQHVRAYVRDSSFEILIR